MGKHDTRPKTSKFCERNHTVAISNVIFETYLYDYTVSVKALEERRLMKEEQSRFIENGRLDMPCVLRKFQEVMRAEYHREDEAFVERQGRLLFLCFLKPIINGTGFYYVEPETRNSTRMDIVVVYGKEEYILELKIWHGAKYREEGIRQLENYLDSKSADRGYLISFSFLKEKKDVCVWIPNGESRKKIFEVTV